MKKSLISLAVAVVMILSLCLSSCGAKLVYKDGVYYCAKNGVTYNTVDLQYSAVTMKNDRYAVLKDGNSKDLFALEGVAPEKWLVAENGDLFCAAGEKVPTLEEMKIDTIIICAAGNAGILALSQIQNADNVKKIMDAYLGDQTLTYPDTNEVSESLILRLGSSDYSWLYYNLSYVEFVNDVLISDYPENLKEYAYRVVDDSVSVEVIDELEVWYKASTKAEQDKYESLASDAGIDQFTVTKPVDGVVDTYVVHVYKSLDSEAECFEYFKANYKGNMSSEQVDEALSKLQKSEKITRVEYNYGKYFVYDRFTGRCVKVDDTLHKYRNYQITD